MRKSLGHLIPGGPAIFAEAPARALGWALAYKPSEPREGQPRQPDKACFWRVIWAMLGLMGKTYGSLQSDQSEGPELCGAMEGGPLNLGSLGGLGRLRESLRSPHLWAPPDMGPPLKFSEVT